MSDKLVGKSLNLIGKAFIIEWCDVCETYYIMCPKCGNNTCNGGYGDNGNCTLCPIAYELDAKLQVYIATELQQFQKVLDK
jgi:hypothetical protein